MAVRDTITDKLQRQFTPDFLDVIDESEKHHGHSGWREGGETHFRVTLAAPGLAGLSRLERHRAVHKALGPDLLGRIHALALDIEG